MALADCLMATPICRTAFIWVRAPSETWPMATLAWLLPVATWRAASFRVASA